MNNKIIKRLRKYGVISELNGETAINLSKIIYHISYKKPDAIIHINPIYCCPGSVSSAILKDIEKIYNIPVLNLFYDGIKDPNANIIPFIYYLKNRKEISQSKKHIWNS